jgi:hypothetical protein
MDESGYDWVMVELERVGEAARRVAAALLNRETQQLMELDEETDGLLDDAFDHSRMALVDSRTAAMILRPPSRIRAYAQLLAAKARLLHEIGSEDEGHSLARRALELQLEAAALEPNLEKIDHAAIDALLDREPPLPLGERHQRLLAELDERT